MHTHTHKHAHTPYSGYTHSLSHPCPYHWGLFIATVTGPWRPLEGGHAGQHWLCVFVYKYIYTILTVSSISFFSAAIPILLFSLCLFALFILYNPGVLVYYEDPYTLKTQPPEESALWHPKIYFKSTKAGNWEAKSLDNVCPVSVQWPLKDWNSSKQYILLEIVGCFNVLLYFHVSHICLVDFIWMRITQNGSWKITPKVFFMSSSGIMCFCLLNTSAKIFGSK